MIFVLGLTVLYMHVHMMFSKKTTDTNYITAQIVYNSGNLCLATWIVKGLGNPIKWINLFIALKCRKLDIIFLQETHLPEQESQKSCKDWFGHVFYSTDSSFK